MRLTHSCARNADLIIVRARSLTKLATSAPDQECDCLANPIANFIDNIILVRIHVDFSTLADNLFMEDFDQTQLSNQLAHWWSRLESNQRHGDFQSPALPTELSGHKLRGPDLNQRPPGYEPGELPDCSTPRYKWRRKRDSNPRGTFIPCRFSRPIPSTGLGYFSVSLI